MKLTKKAKAFLMSTMIIATLGSIVGCSSNNSDSTYNKVDSAKTEKLTSDNKKTLVIDVRSSDEYAKGHLVDAINIPFDEFKEKINELDGYKDQKIILICNTGNKSGKGAQMLVDNGFKKVYNAEDGMDKFDYSTVTYTNVTGSEFENMIAKNKNAVIIDVRDAKDYEKSHIENSINIPIDDFESRFNELEEYKGKDILIYCSIGRRSAKAAGILENNGYTNVYNAVDGVTEYDFKLVK